MLFRSTGSASSSSSDEDKKAKKAKSKSRSASRKRASIFGGLLGKKDKAEDKKDESKVEGESSKAVPEVKKDEAATVAHVTEASTTTPVITTDIPKASEDVKTDATPAPIVVPTTEESKAESTTKTADEKPKPTKRGSIFGAFFEKVKSPTSEKKEGDLVPAPITKDSEPAAEASKPLDEAVIAAPTTIEPASEPAALKTDEGKPTETKPAVSTPSKEKEHFSFGKLFGNKDRAKSPAATDKAPAPEASKVDAVAPKIEDTTTPVVSEPVEPVVAAPATESKVEPAATDKKEETTPVKKEKRGSIFGSLGRSLSKVTKSKDPKEKDTAVTPTTVPEASEPKEEKAVGPLDDKKDETPVAAAPAEKSIGDVVPEAVTVGEAPKSSSTVPTTA